MKMWKTKTWQPETTGTAENALLFGVRIFDYEWTDTRRQIRVSDLPFAVSVYQVTIRDTLYEFAAEERSCGVWNFYLYKY